MPFLSFHVSAEDTIRSAGVFADAVKVEGGGKRVEMIRALVNCEIPVMGHLGLTPQSVNAMDGFKVQGRTADDALRLLGDAHQLEQAGCFALVLEGIPAELAARATESLSIPTIGIGAGPSCSGQVLVFHEVLGLTGSHRPKFIRVYVEGRQLLQEDLSRWAADVRSAAPCAAGVISTCGRRLARLDRKLDAFQVKVVHGQLRAETEIRTTGTSRIQYGTVRNISPSVIGLRSIARSRSKPGG